MTKKEGAPVGSSCCVDTIVVAGKVITMDRAGTVAEAVAIKDGRILCAGTRDQIQGVAGPCAKVIDAGGRTVLPGFIDTHAHPANVGARLGRVNCMTPMNKSVDDVLTRIAEEVKRHKPGEWVLAGGYNLGLIWEREGRHINRWDLDQVAPQNPVQVASVGGHTGSIYNSAALKLAGIDETTPDPAPPAVIDRDHRALPSGRVSESAEAPLIRLIPEPDLEQRKELLRKAGQQFRSWGITTMHDATGHPDDLAAYQSMLADGKMMVRTGMMMRHSVLRTPAPGAEKVSVNVLEGMKSVGIKAGFGSEWLWIIGTKILADGAFTGRTAAMSEPYEGEPVDPSSPLYKGLLHHSVEDIHHYIYDSHLAGLRPCVHAQGDYGINVVLDGIEKALKDRPVKDHRIRIEHSGLTTPAILERMQRLGLCVSSSISFLGGDVSTNWVYWGPERMKWSYALKSLKEYGIVAAGNGDCPVTTGDPIVGIATAVTRRAITGEILGSNQAIPVVDALRLYSTNAAYLEFGEGIKGSIEPGKLADLVILDRDPTAIPPDELRDMKVVMTILDGKVVYER